MRGSSTGGSGGSGRSTQGAAAVAGGEVGDLLGGDLPGAQQADAARKWQVDVSTVIKIRRLAKDAALAAFAASKPGRPRSPFEVELEAERAENARLSEALKEMAVELTLVRGKSRWG